nr:malate:quinone oxidoreductase [Massilia sp. UBA6681]
MAPADRAPPRPARRRSEGPEARRIPLSGQFPVATIAELVNQHHANVYGKASVGSPPM